jgi:hypothetical protein
MYCQCHQKCKHESRHLYNIYIVFKIVQTYSCRFNLTAFASSLPFIIHVHVCNGFEDRCRCRRRKLPKIATPTKMKFVVLVMRNYACCYHRCFNPFLICIAVASVSGVNALFPSYLHNRVLSSLSFPVEEAGIKCKETHACIYLPASPTGNGWIVTNQHTK